MRNARACVFSHWILDLLNAKRGISSVYGELLPYLVHKQFKNDPLFNGESFHSHDSSHRCHHSGQKKPYFPPGHYSLLRFDQ